ncbi:MAG: DUF58 domain-containing protein [Acidimicrobiales bacterium]
MLRHLDLLISRRLDGLLHGDYLGLVPGHGSDLGETRRYQAGDDVRRIDWNVTARLQEPYVRETIADRELETWLLVDQSPSLDFGTAFCEKRDLAISGAAAVGFLTARTGNRIGAVLLAPDATITVPARGGRDHLMALLHRVVAAKRAEGGVTDLAAGISRMALTTRRRGLAVVISDFLGDDTWVRPLSRLAVRHETLCVEIVDPREVELPSVGVLQLVDPRTGALHEVQTSNPRLRERYAEAARAQRGAIADGIRGAGSDHLQLRTDRDWLLDLISFVAARRQRVRGTAQGVAR